MTYRFRHLDAAGMEHKGEGKVFEKYRRMPGTGPNNHVVVDEGGRLHVEAGTIRLNWSRAGTRSGWVYYHPEKLRVQISTTDKFEKIDLERFRW